MENRRDALNQQVEALVVGNEEVFVAIASAKDAAEVAKLLNENGIVITVEETEEYMAEGMAKILQYKETHPDGELSLDELEDVAGGGPIKGTLRLLGSCVVGAGYGVLCALCPPLDAGIPYVVGGLTIWTTAGYYAK